MNENQQNLPDIFEELQAIAATDRPRMLESDFVANVLPLLTTPHYEQRGEDLTPWLNIAGTPHAEVDIVNENREVLFIVPPILARTATLVDREGMNMSVSAIASNYASMLGSTHPAQADLWFLNQIREVVADPSEEQMLQYLRMWLYIRVRYGLPVTDLIGEVQPVAPQVDEEAPSGEAEGSQSAQPSPSKFDDFDL